MWTEEMNIIFEQLSQSDAAASPEALYKELLREISGYHPSNDTTMIEKAYQTASLAHTGQTRKSGEPYIIHPLCVAIILSKLKMDKETIEAALLHDVVEDTGMTNEELADIFGEDVAQLVDGVTKLTRLPKEFDVEEVQAANLRKMFLAMAKDIRVIIIKLADRLHNLRTLQYQPPEKQIKIARETIEIYAPLAMKLGISKIKVELDDLSLQYLQPNIYRFLTEEINKIKPVQERYKNQILQKIEAALSENQIIAKVYSRTKHLFSIYKKMVNQSKQMIDIYDVFAICIIVGSVKDCYTVLGILHETYSPVYGRFKDYIAMPKQNMYQSLHTTIISDSGKMVEIQVKTYEMAMTAEYGITAYWKYNKIENGEVVKRSMYEKMVWLQQILDWQRDLADNRDFLGTLKEDFNLLAERISCFTPKGDVIILPKGSTSIDFAYSIHTVIGNTMTGSLINKAEAPITRTLRDGDIVEIITSPTADGPGREWLRHVKTPQAKNKIKEWLKKHPKPEDADRKDSFVLLDIKVKNRVGMLEDITRILAAHKMKIRTIRVKNENKEPVAITVEICVGNMQVPAEMTAQIAAVSEVSSVDMRVVS